MTTHGRHGIMLRGFTLIELLVVVAIIAILMGILLTGVGVVREGAKRKKAQTEAMAIADAIKRYRQTYGKYPGQKDSAADKTLATNGANSALLRQVYGALTNTAGVKDNLRRVKFLTLNDSGVDSHGYYAIDPWGNGYVVGLDWDGDGMVENMTLPSGVQTTIVNQTVAVASGGQKYGSKDSQEVYSWRR